MEVGEGFNSIDAIDNINGYSYMDKLIEASNGGLSLHTEVLTWAGLEVLPMLTVDTS